MSFAFYLDHGISQVIDSIESVAKNLKALREELQTEIASIKSDLQEMRETQDEADDDDDYYSTSAPIEINPGSPEDAAKKAAVLAFSESKCSDKTRNDKLRNKECENHVAQKTFETLARASYCKDSRQLSMISLTPVFWMARKSSVLPVTSARPSRTATAAMRQSASSSGVPCRVAFARMEAAAR